MARTRSRMFVALGLLLLYGGVEIVALLKLIPVMLVQVIGMENLFDDTTVTVNVELIDELKLPPVTPLIVTISLVANP